jgi:excisionase family DNA binding protein
MVATQTDPIPINPRISDNNETDAVVGTGLLCCRKLTVPKAAKQLGIGETKMRELISHGEIRVLNLAGKILLLERDLENYLEGNYGSIERAARTAKNKLPPLPKHVAESRHIRKRNNAA